MDFSGDVDEQKDFPEEWYTESSPSQPAPLYRPALGHVAELGDLYDARREMFCGCSLLNQSVPDSAVSTVSNGSQRAEVVIVQSSLDVCEKLDISAELQLGILAKLVSLESAGGSASYVKENKTEHHEAEAVLLYRASTEAQRINLLRNDVRKCLNVDVLNADSATHVVTEIRWGARTVLSVTEQLSSELERGAVEAKFKAALTNVANDVNSASKSKDSASSMSNCTVKLYSDIPTDSVPTTFDEAVKLMHNLPASLKDRGRQMTYVLFPLTYSLFRQRLGLPVPSPFKPVKQLDDKLAGQFVKLFESISRLYDELNDYVDYADSCDLAELLELVLGLQNGLGRMQKELRESVQEAVLKIRSDEASDDVLMKLFDPARKELMAVERKLDESVKRTGYPYVVTVFTGNKTFSGTDANVFIKLFGKYRNSDELPLQSSKTHDKCFQRGQADVFTVTVPLLLRLTRLRVWHDNTGSMPGWFLDKVKVEDPRSQQQYEFHCNKWLCEGDEHVGRLSYDMLPHVESLDIAPCSIEDQNGHHTHSDVIKE